MSKRHPLSAAALDLFLGSTCVGCRRPGPVLCLACGAELEQLPFVAWPSPRPTGLPRPYAVAAYDGAVKAAVVEHKEHGALPLARPLGRALALSVMATLAEDAPSAGAAGRLPVLLVAPPTSAARVRSRGHDPLLRIVKACLGALRASGIPADATPVLERTRDLADQSGLSAEERAANLAGAYRARSRRLQLPGRRAVVVDDVVTTGATAAEVARALERAGLHVIGVAVVAATRRTHPPVEGMGLPDGTD